MIKGVETGSITNEGYIPIKLKILDGADSDGDKIDCRYYKTGHQWGSAAVILVGGVGGGWNSPAKGLYNRLSHKLAKDDEMNTLRIRFRYPTNLEECIVDVLAGIEFLTQAERKTSIGLVGHSFGGAVVISSAALAKDFVKTVVTLATQSYGTQGISKLEENECPILLIHGNSDDVLSSYCSSYVYTKAKEPKQLLLYDNAGHSLDEVADKVFHRVHEWLGQNLNRSGSIL
ncbi:MAG TPA: dienelactone hydrolase family protein [Bacillales bacterium]|nr:dienelactone hydrolase family protein [Bacillales bacterium]